ncbi:DsbA family oxidoreductase [Marinobacter persicus]|uniref:DsbA family dithiol-disulfide isomerase n=1 Tax=Marinobacter persicus TaxID=930118 RepID=A0A2S6G2X7_9GAMM|nr:DsbA family oxidoreductase [Marinobacter persicus]PPK50188.1 putative DsbA family dithiol-disulfide isomerase [Marinobacter persicus]PPK52645.1 putative DsbA family dithiol-disulfide isomerase [Marinobacter persicus]PPK56707.1 putative DsbA family dithiol-disulfide isomerase [Marinobacter persicus]
MKTLQIDLVSDIACPWCAIGYARLEQAMEKLSDELAFTVRWHAFELNPDHGEEGEHILPALAKKYGRSEAEMRATQDNMIRIATELGLNFEKMQERYTCNTFDAHRLVKWAEGHGRQTDLKKALFDAYFGKAENVSDPEVLARCVEAAGLDASEARDVLASDQYAQTVRDDEATYQQAGVTAVPAFVVNNQYLISGAQEPEALIEAFREIAGGSGDAS